MDEIGYKNLLELQKRFDFVLSTSNQALYIFNKKTKSVSWSKNARAVFGYDGNELDTFEKWSQRIHPSQRNLIVNRFCSALTSNAHKNFEYLFQHKNGNYIYIKETLAETEDGNDEITGIMQDISTIKDQEKKIRDLEVEISQIQKTEIPDNTISVFVHDFNNIINGILGFAQLLKMKLKEQPKLDDYASKIVQASMEAISLLQKLTLSSIKNEGKKEIVDIHNVIGRSVELINRAFSENIDTQINLTSKKCHVIGRYSQIQNILISLAIKAKCSIGNGGKLKFETRYRDILEPISKLVKEFIEITVTGTGLVDNTQEPIITQACNHSFAAGSQEKCFGLDLSLVAETVKGLSGNVTVNSTHHGVKFTILLPVCDNSSNEKNSGSVTTAKVEKENYTILVVDDEKNIRDFIAEYLSDLGYTVYKASNGKEGYETFSTIKEQLSLVILDIVMPEMNGKEFYKKIEKTNIPVIFISGHTKDTDIKTFLGKPTNAFLQKPFTPDKISQQILSLTK